MFHLKKLGKLNWTELNMCALQPCSFTPQNSEPSLIDKNIKDTYNHTHIYTSVSLSIEKKEEKEGGTVTFGKCYIYEAILI